MRSATENVLESGGFDPEAHCVFELIWPSSEGRGFAGPSFGAGWCAAAIMAGAGSDPFPARGSSASVPGCSVAVAGTLGRAGADGATTVNFQVAASFPTARFTLWSPPMSARGGVKATLTSVTCANEVISTSSTIKLTSVGLTAAWKLTEIVGCNWFVLLLGYGLRCAISG